jgi:hypothetical protein
VAEDDVVGVNEVFEAEDAGVAEDDAVADRAVEDPDGGGGAGDPDAEVVDILGGGAGVSVFDPKKPLKNPLEDAAGPPKISISLSASLLSCVASTLTRLSGFPLIPDTRFLATWAVGSNSSLIKCVKPFVANV